MSQEKQQLPAFYSLLYGGIAGSVAKTAIAPFDRVKIHFQVAHPELHEFRGNYLQDCCSTVNFIFKKDDSMVFLVLYDIYTRPPDFLVFSVVILQHLLESFRMLPSTLPLLNNLSSCWVRSIRVRFGPNLSPVPWRELWQLLSRILLILFAQE